MGQKMQIKKTIGQVLIGVGITFISLHSYAEKCREIHWRQGNVIDVKSSIYLGTRIQLPSDLVTKPIPSNKDLWDVDGASNTIMVKPNSDTMQGEATIIRAFTADGNSYDIKVSRVPKNLNQTCVIVKNDGQFFNGASKNALGQLSQNVQMNQQGALFAQQNSNLMAQLEQTRAENDESKRKAVMEALRRFRYSIYTRYEWDKGSGFAASNIISDIYDDGRFTYIRLAHANKGLLSVESEIGEQNAIVPAKYDDTYGMYTINGIYPKFTLRVDDSKINIKRSDSKTFGE